MRRWLIVGLVVTVLLGAAAWAGYRLYYGDPVKTVFCQLVACPELEGYESLCRAAAIVEFSEFVTVTERHSALLETLLGEPEGDRIREPLLAILEQPPPERYARIERAARESGAPGWQCPALKRVVTSTVP